MNRSSLGLAICFALLNFSAFAPVRAEVPPEFTRRSEPYYPPGPPIPIVSPETGLPQSWSTVGPEPFFGNPYLWGGYGYGFGYGWGGGWYGGRGFGYGALGAYAPFGFGYGGSGYAYPRGPYWSAYRFGPYGWGSTGFGDPRYGANFAGPYSGFYGPAQATPGYRTYGPYNPPSDAVVIPGLTQPGLAQPQEAPAQIIAPGELPVPPVPQGP